MYLQIRKTLDIVSDVLCSLLLVSTLEILLLNKEAAPIHP